MTLEYVLSTIVGKATAKFLFRRYLGDFTGEIGSELVDIGADQFKDYFKRREHAIKFEEMANAITKRLLNIFPEFEVPNPEPVVFEVGKCIEKYFATLKYSMAIRLVRAQS